MYLARRYRNRGLAYLDVIEEGNLGLITAADRFDPERGIRFATYASWWIRQAILRGLADQANSVRIPLKVLRQVRASSPSNGCCATGSGAIPCRPKSRRSSA